MSDYTNYYEWIDQLNSGEEYDIRVIPQGQDGWDVYINGFTYRENTLFRTLEKAHFAENGFVLN